MFISQTTDFHFANYRFSFRKLQIFISQTIDSHFANYRFSFRKLQISISQTTDFHFANYRFPFRFVPFRFANYSKPCKLNYKLEEVVLTQLMLDDHNKVITLTLCIWLVFWYDFQGLEPTFASHLQVRNEISKKKKIS